jgi:XTP/dITP diphosphohydrolase
MRKLLIATKNERKLRELKHLLGDVGFEIISLVEFPDIPAAQESGKTFEENSASKALFYANQSGILCLADDSGLEVDALGGEPGVKSARYAGPNATDATLCGKLLKNLDNVPEEKRTAKFTCAASLAQPGKVLFTVIGTCAGRIGHEMRGTGGFGYDPVFYPDGWAKTFAEMSPSEKDSVSHRARALAKFKEKLLELYGAV